MSLNRVAECVILLMQLRKCARKHAVIFRPAKSRNVPKTQRGERNKVQAASAIVLAACGLKTRSRHSGILSDRTKPKGRLWDVLILETMQNDPCENIEVCIACGAPLMESVLKQAFVME